MSGLGRTERTEVIKASLLGLAEDRGGRLSPAHVLDAARDPSSPLHAEFEWDDAKAGEAFRLVQAGALIRSVRIKVVTESADPRRVSMVVQRGLVSMPSLRGSDEGSYVPVVSVVDRSELLNEVVKQLEVLRRKYSSLSTLNGVWKAIEEVAPA